MYILSIWNMHYKADNIIHIVMGSLKWLQLFGVIAIYFKNYISIQLSSRT